jgi:hypothetical protein
MEVECGCPLIAKNVNKLTKAPHRALFPKEKTCKNIVESG